MKFPQTLWDLLPRGLRPAAAAPAARPAPVREPPAERSKPAAARLREAKTRPGSMQQRYDHVTRQMLVQHGLRVRKWRTSMSGIAWQITYRDGTIARLIEAPRPRGPMSAAVFLHEVGHHAIGFNTYKPRCLEEYHAWAWAIAAMEANGLNVTDAVRNRMAESLRYAIAKARRRGLRELPPELRPFDLPRAQAAPRTRRTGAPTRR